MNNWSRTLRKAHAASWLAVALLMPALADAYTVNITAGTRVVYLAVGNGSFTGTLSAGGTPANNATINTVSVTVAANVVGNATGQAMNTNSTQSASFYDAFAFCTCACGHPSGRTGG